MFSLNQITTAWNKFFFEEKSTDGIALFRIIWMGLILIYFLIDLGNIHDFYGPEAIISFGTARSQFPDLHANLFNLFNPSYEATHGLLIVYGISLVLSVFGLFTRWSLVVALLCMTSLHQRNIWLLSSSEMLMRAITLFLIFSPCGHSLSIDSLLGRFYSQFRQKRMWSVWALRLIQIQISVVYLWTFWHKLKGDTWIDGTAVYYATRLESMRNFSIPYLMDSTLFLKFLTWSTLVLEFSLGALIWIKEFRKPVIFIGILFHLGIEFMMTIPFFELYMIALLINFFTPEELKSFVDNLRKVFLDGIEDSSIAQGVKEKIVRTLRGQHETAN
jgi:hypothetical protein